VVTRTFNAPARLVFEAWTRPELARPHAADLLRGDESRLLQDTDVLLHARQGQVEFLGKLGDRGVRTRQLLQNAASRDVRERGE
jgi:hypothetical protein